MDFAFRFLWNEEVGCAEEAQQKPDDQAVGVQHARDVEWQDFGQEVAVDIDPAHHEAQRHLHRNKAMATLK